MHSIHGVTRLEWLAASGITERMISRRPEYERVGNGVYALHGARRDFWFHAAVAVLVAGDQARLTAGSSLFAHGIIEKAPPRTQVVVPEGKGSRRRRGFDVRRSSHLPETARSVNHIPCVSPAYALTDYARDADDQAVAYALSRALAFRHFSLDDLQAVMDERGRWPGSARLRRVLQDFASGESHSRRERTLRGALGRVGVRLRPGSVLVKGTDGRPVAQLDIATVGLKLDIEVDGPHHLDPRQQERDRKRDRALVALGWTVVRFSIYEIDADVDRVAREIARLVQQMQLEAAA